MDKYTSEQKRKMTHFFYIVLAMASREKFEKNFNNALMNLSDYVSHLSEEELNSFKDEIWEFQSHTLLDVIWAAIHNKESIAKLRKDNLDRFFNDANKQA